MVSMRLSSVKQKHSKLAMLCQAKNGGKMAKMPDWSGFEGWGELKALTRAGLGGYGGVIYRIMVSGYDK